MAADQIGLAVSRSLTICGLGQVSDRLDGEPDDRLSAEDERLTRELTDRGTPELVEALLADHPTMHRVHIARAYARAAVEMRDAALRERFFRKAAKEYRKVIALEGERGWLKGLRRCFDVAQWRVEHADLILRYWIAPDLDRFEITSGLDYDRRRLTTMLHRARQLYRDAAPAMDGLTTGLRTEEERFLLVGLGELVPALRERREINCAWANLYLGMTGEIDAIDRQDLLESALMTFDATSRAAKEPEARYGALIGAGIALRELGRHGEADAAFDRVREMAIPASLRVRARYEKARCLIRAGRFDLARRELDELAGMSSAQDGKTDSAAFYIRLAPIIHAYSYLVEARERRAGAPAKAKLLEKAASELAALADQGRAPSDVVQVYLDALGGGQRKPQDLTPAELKARAGRLMAAKDFARAAEVLRVLVKRAEPGGPEEEAWFNLGVCCFQSQDLRGAADAFTTAARGKPAPNLAPKAAEYAYRCWCQLAQASQDAADYRRLAEAADWFAGNSPDRPEAASVIWTGALAWQQVGDYQSAADAYAKIPPGSPHYWEARRNIARCRQSLYEAAPRDAPIQKLARLARSAAAAWTDLAKDLVDASPRTATSGPGQASTAGAWTKADRDRWTQDALLAAGTILADDPLRAYDECLKLLADVQPTAGVLALRIRCHRGLGDFGAVKRALDDFMKQAPGDEAGAVLAKLAAEMESHTNRLRELGRPDEAARAAESSLPTFRGLLDWINGQPEYAKHAPIVRFSLTKALAQARRQDEALAELDQLMADDPANGLYVRTAALLEEERAASISAADRERHADRAEALWAKLLEDGTLREQAPEEYWEARYHWLRHQLRHGRAELVVKGIGSEKAWFPDLGGPPWQGRLLELLDQASRAAATQPDKP